MEALEVRIINLLVQNDIISHEDTDVYIYGADLLLYTIASFGALIAIGAFLGFFIETVFFLSTVAMFQSTGGGYHAKTHLRCFLIMAAAWLSCLCLIHSIPLNFIPLICFLGCACIFKLAPIIHPNAPMSADKQNRMRRLVRWLSISVSFIVIILTAINIYLPAVAVGIFVSGVSMICASFKRGVVS